MLKHAHMLQEFEESRLRRESPDYFRSLRVFEALFEEAKALGVLPPHDPLEGIEVDIRVAKVMHVYSTVREDRAGAG
jgi:hypothetical protein